MDVNDQERWKALYESSTADHNLSLVTRALSPAIGLLLVLIGISSVMVLSPVSLRTH